MATSNDEAAHRNVIQFCTDLGMTPVDIFKKMQSTEKHSNVSRAVIYHHDNAPSHTAEKTQLEIDVLGFQRLEHPPYSPDLALLDFAYFPLLKEHLRGQRFEDAEELMKETLIFNRRLGKDWCKCVFEKWVKRHRLCVQHHGKYFEKE